MKVLKKSVDTVSWNLTFTCNYCDSELQAFAGDIMHSSYDGDFREPYSESYSVNCAVCKYPHPIAFDKIPKLIRLEAKNKKSTDPGGLSDR